MDSQCLCPPRLFMSGTRSGDSELSLVFVTISSICHYPRPEDLELLDDSARQVTLLTCTERTSRTLAQAYKLM